MDIKSSNKDTSGTVFPESDNALLLARRPGTSNTLPGSKAVLESIFLAQLDTHWRINSFHT